MKDGSAALSRARTWDTFFADDHVAEFRRSLYLAVYGNEYPAELGTDGYVTRSQLNQLAQALQVGPGARIADLGCGRGGPGQLIARITGAALVGIDFSEVALQQARDRARQLGISDAVSYKAGTFDSTGLDPSNCDAAMSVDVIWAIPDKLAGFTETARILKPGARFAFTDWQRDLSPPGYPAALNDHRPLLKAAGFEVELHQVLADAETLRRAFYEKMLARQQELISDVGEQAAQWHLREAKAWLGLIDGVDYLKHSRRVLVAARKPERK